MKFNIGDEVIVIGGEHKYLGITFKVEDIMISWNHIEFYKYSHRGYPVTMFAEDHLRLVKGNPSLKETIASQSQLLEERQQSLDLYHGIIESQEAEIARLTKIIKDSIETLKTLRIT